MSTQDDKAYLRTDEEPSLNELIVEAALDTIIAETISGTRLREIARRAGISQGHLHYYYPTKSKLFQGVIDYLERFFLAWRKEQLLTSDPGPIGRLKWFFQQKTEVILEEKPPASVFFDLVVQSARDPEILDRMHEWYAGWREDMEAVVSDGVEKGVFDPRYAAWIPRLLVSILEGAALQHLLDGDSFDLETYFSVSFEILLKMLGTTPTGSRQQAETTTDSE